MASWAAAAALTMPMPETDSTTSSAGSASSMRAQVRQLEVQRADDRESAQAIDASGL